MHPRLGDKEGGSPGPTGTDRTSPSRSLLFLAKGPGKGYPAIRLSESTLLLQPNTLENTVVPLPLMPVKRQWLGYNGYPSSPRGWCQRRSSVELGLSSLPDGDRMPLLTPATHCVCGNVEGLSELAHRSTPRSADVSGAFYPSGPAAGRHYSRVSMRDRCGAEKGFPPLPPTVLSVRTQRGHGASTHSGPTRSVICFKHLSL